MKISLKIFVAVNLSDKPVEVTVNLNNKNSCLKNLSGAGKFKISNSGIKFRLQPYGIDVLGS